VLKRFYATNTVRHVLAFRRVCSYHGVHSFVFCLLNTLLLVESLAILKKRLTSPWWHIFIEENNLVRISKNLLWRRVELWLQGLPNNQPTGVERKL
jgi:hypothetical protein